MFSERSKVFNHAKSTIVDAAEKCATDPFSDDNLAGYLNFGIAENYLIDDIILEKTGQSISDPSIHHYQPVYGTVKLREAFCIYLENFFFKRKYNPDNIVLGSGASSILEMISFAILNPGDVMAVSAPYYPGFNYDIENRFNGDLQYFNEDMSDPDATINFLKKSNTKGYILCHPNNPTGNVYSREFLETLVNFCEKEKIHLFVDEVYAGTNLSGEKFQSSLEFIEGKQYIHFIYSMAKDFGLGGYKIGFLYSENSELIKLMRYQSYFHTPSAHTQYLIADMLLDKEWVTRLRSKVTERINSAFEIIENGVLKTICDSYTEPKHGFFSFIQLKSVSKGVDDDALFKLLIDDLKVSMIPGKYFGIPDEGYVRMCFAKPTNHIHEFCKRLSKLNC